MCAELVKSCTEYGAAYRSAGAAHGQGYQSVESRPAVSAGLRRDLHVNGTSLSMGIPSLLNPNTGETQGLHVRVRVDWYDVCDPAFLFEVGFPKPGESKRRA